LPHQLRAAKRPSLPGTRSRQHSGTEAPLLTTGSLSRLATTLQTRAGNTATSSLLAAVQAKLVVGRADDPYEREADAIATEVLARLRSTTTGPLAPPLQPDGNPAPANAALGRAAQRDGQHQVGPEGGQVATEDEARLTSASSSGSGLPSPIRRQMETAFGADFGNVRLHSGSEPEHLSEKFGAAAFTVGPHVFLGRSAPSLSTPAGQSLIAHELVHTIQQGAVKQRLY
jgi:hypothetical protein